MIRTLRNTAALLAVILVSCQPANGPDLLSKATQDVTQARAAARQLTITADPSGTTSPAGNVSLKDGFSIDIEGTAQPESVLVGWKQTGGSGKATFTPVTTTRVNVKVSGGDATIAPVYLPRPSVLYMLPSGNNVAKNVSIRIVFDQKVDVTSGLSSFVTLKDQSTSSVAYTDNTVAKSNTIVLKPNANLANYSTYIVTALAGIPLAADFASSAFKDVTLLNKTVISRAQVASSFTTGNQTDNIPPYNGAFGIASTTGDFTYTASRSVTLLNIQSDDDSGPGGVDRMAAYNTVFTDATPATATIVPTPVAADFSIPFTSGMNYAWNLGGAGAVRDGIYSVSLLFRDQSGNAQSYVDPLTTGSTAYQNIYLDATPPNVSSLTFAAASGVKSYLNGTTLYVNGLGVTYTLAASDPNLANTPSTIKGSGESSNGSNSVERKTFQLSNDGVNFSAMSAYASNGSWTLAAGADGPRTAIQVKVADGVGNSSAAFTQGNPLLFVDTTAPTLAVAGSLTTIYSKTASLPLTLTASDSGSGLNTYKLSNPTDGRPLGLDGTAANVTSTQTYASSIVATLSSGQGAKSFDVTVADQVGNAVRVPVNAVFDNVAPAVQTPSFVQSVSPTSLNNLTVTVAAPDATSGNAFIYWRIGSSAVSGPVDATWTKVSVAATGPYSIPVSWSPLSQTETKYLGLVVEDKAGNQTSVVSPSSAITYNNVAPTGSVVVTTSPLVPKKSAFSITWSAVATNNIRLTKIEMSNDGAAWKDISTSLSSGSPLNTLNGTSGGSASFDPLDATYGGTSANGSRTVYVRLTSDNGKSSIATTTYTFDNTPPYVYYYTVSGTGGTAASYSAGLTVTFWLWDNVTSYSGTTNNTYRLSTTGNVNNAADWTSPVMETNYNNSVTFNLGSAPSFTPVNGTTYTVYLEGKDEAGNTTTVSQSILYDNAAPVVTAFNGVPVTVGDRVVSLTTNVVDPVPGGGTASGLSQMETWSDGNYSGWQTYSPTASFLLTPLNAVKNLYIHYKDVAGNVSNWVYTGGVTLSSTYSNLFNGNWVNIAGANYANPASRAAVSNLGYIAGTTRIDLTNGSQGPRSYVYQLASGNFGWFDYYISGTSVSFYYQTFTPGGVALQTNWTYYGLALPSSGNYAYFDLDSTSGNLGTTYNASTVDMYIQNIGGIIYLYPSGSVPLKWSLF